MNAPAPSANRTHDVETTGGRVLYVYCIGNAAALAGFVGSGVDEDGPVALVTGGTIAALVSAVAADTFCGAAAEERMKDLAWLAPRACRHEEIVERALAISPIVPLRFATLFSSPARLQAWLARHETAMRAALECFATHQEWAVKGRLDRDRAAAPLLAEALAREPPAATAGVRYLHERRVRAQIGHAVSAWVRESGREIAAALREHAMEVRDRGLGAAQTAGAETLIFNWAFLVPIAGVAAFQACVEGFDASLRERGLSVECSGPWPPYSFTPTIGGEDDAGA